MTGVLSELPLSYALLSEGRRCGSASTVHEPSPAGRPYRALPARARRTLRPRDANRALARVLNPAGTAASQSGQKGTKQLFLQYGDCLIWVRYRYDAQREKRFKTVEFLVAERDWGPPRRRFAYDQIVGLRVGFADVAVRERVKQAGGTWNSERRVWQLPHDRVVALGLTSRIVDEPASNSGCPGRAERISMQMPGQIGEKFHVLRQNFEPALPGGDRRQLIDAGVIKRGLHGDDDVKGGVELPEAPSRETKTLSSMA
jgi:hypothetical protein